MKYLGLLALCAGLMTMVSCESMEAPVKQEAQTTIDFKGAGLITGWGKTATLEATPKTDCLELKGKGWDSKMFYPLDLQPGYYLLTATGKGQNLHVRLATSLDTTTSLFDMNLSRDTWRTDWRPFTIDKPRKIWLLAHLMDGGTSWAELKQIKIEKATPPPEETGIPTPQELERQRPSPEMARGCGHGGKENLAPLKTWGANLTRKWIDLKPDKYVDGVAEYAPGWEGQLAKLEAYLEAARKAGLKVVLTLNGGAFHENCQKQGWDNPKLPGVVAAVWKGIARRLLPYRDVIYGYDLYNEPLDWNQMPAPPRQWRDIAKAALKAIREVDQQTWIVYETGPGGLSWGFAGMKPLPDPRVIYSVHFYNPHEFTHQGIEDIRNTDLAEVKTKLNVRYPGVVNGLLWNKEQIKKDLGPARAFQLKYHVPMLVGEFSVVRWAPKEDAVRYLKDLVDIFEEYHWSWIYHCFREYQGWSVEYDDNYPVNGKHVLAPTETERAKVIKAGLAKNLESAHAAPPPDAALRSQLELVSDLKDFKPGDNELRLCFLGDSITRHGFNKTTIENLKWDHLAGMAASSADKDFAHLVAAQISRLTGKKARLFFAGGGASKLALSAVAYMKDYQPDVVIVQQGEHVPSKDFGGKVDQPHDEIVAEYAALLDGLKALPSSPLIICTGIWDPQQNWAPGIKKYIRRVAEIEAIQQEVCGQKGVPFVSVEKYALDPACSGTGGSAGVKWHPNDKGHAGYAKEIVDAFVKVYKPGKGSAK